MAMQAEEIKQLITSGIEGAEVIIKDLAGDGEHYAVEVISAAFGGLSKVQQHQLVYKSLGERMGGQLHALAITTKLP